MSQAAIPNPNGRNLPTPTSASDQYSPVRTMFSAIAGSYDHLNSLLSFNQDRRWRRQAAALAQLQPDQTLLDLCCGTGELALACWQAQPHLRQIVGLDFAQPMLDLAQQKTQRPDLNIAKSDDRHNSLPIQWLRSDAHNLPFPDNHFDCVTCAFGIRNLQRPAVGINEAFRVLKPQGKLVILEFTYPKNALLRWAYQLYFRTILPMIGQLVSRDTTGAYRYLPTSVHHFRAAAQLDSLIRAAGFSNIQRKDLTCGVVLAMLAEKP